MIFCFKLIVKQLVNRYSKICGKLNQAVHTWLAPIPSLLQLDETPLFAPQVSLEKSLIVSVTLVFCLRALPFFPPHPIIAYQTCPPNTTNHCLHFNCISLLFVAFPTLTTTARGIASGSLWSYFTSANRTWEFFGTLKLIFQRLMIPKTRFQ